MVHVKRLPGVRRYYHRAFVNLPDDTVLLVLQYLNVEDLYRMRRVCRRFHDLIDNSPGVFVHTSFASLWPSPSNFRAFKRASKAGNIEAVIKMGISYLYNEGVSCNCSKKISRALNERNASKAAKYFFLAENITPQSVSFIWTFIRPPWAASSMCCKRHVFKSLVDFCTKCEDADASIMFSVGKVLCLLEEVSLDVEECKATAEFWLEKAAQKGSAHAKFELWKLKRTSQIDTAAKIQELRELRECLQGNREAELELCLNYASGNIGNLDRGTAAETIKKFLASSLPCRRRGIFQYQTDLNRTMRYILVDWLVEVTTMKDFNSHILHAAIWYVDQYLLRRKTAKSKLQLLGIGCMLIASRFYGEDIVTIRESSWLTDNTYSYEDVVRMIGEIMGCLRGATEVLTVPKYIELFCELVKAEGKEEKLALYIADMSLLREHCGKFTSAVVALACTLLAKLICQPEYTWPSSLDVFLPFSKDHVTDCIYFLFQKCLADCPILDQKNVKLKAVKERYETSQRLNVSKMKIPDQNKMIELIFSFSFVAKDKESKEETVLGSTFGSIASSGYEGDDEDFEDIADAEDDEEMMWYDDEPVEQGRMAGQKRKSDDSNDEDNTMEVLDCHQIERSTPSFLSPGWLQNVVGDTTSHRPRGGSLGSNEPREGLARVQSCSVGADVSLSDMRSRRPLMNVNSGGQSPSSGSSAVSKSQTRFRPIHGTSGDSENVNMNC